MDNFLNPEEFNVDNLFKGKYNIPIYQRPYSWGKEEVEQLLKDIDAAYDKYLESNRSGSSVNNEEMLLFTGTLFIKINQNVKNAYTDYDIVDGQQRITTITLILMTILNHLYSVQSDDDIVKDIENYLWKKTGRVKEKDKRVLSLGNIDKQIMTDLFDRLYAKSDIIDFAKNKLDQDIDVIERNLLSNLLIIDDHYISNFRSEEDYYDYFVFIKYNIRFIAIEVHTNLVKLFSIFESINSKGKPLEEIDLLKSYIFQNIDENDYDEYLNKWGKLIIETKDNLMDYFTVYIRSNISYYRNSIKLYNFKTLAEQGLANYYGTDCLRDTLTHLIDDMIENVEFYKMLKDVDLLDTIHASNKTKVFFMMSNIAEYKHNKALYFKLMMLKKKNNLPNNVFEELIEYAFKFILTFQSVCSRESKATLGVFVDVQNKFYDVVDRYDCNIDLSSVNFDSIIMIFNKNIIANAITEETLRRDIRTNLTFQSNKKVVKILLSYLEYQGDDNKIDYLKLLWLLKVGKDIHIDHILPLKPDKNDENYRYYADDESVFLKEGQDFIRNNKNHKYNLTDFYNEYLNVLGNLRLEWSNDNIKKSNHMIVIKEFDSSFNTNNQISTRSISLNKQIISSGILLYNTNLKKVNEDSEGNDLYKLNEYIDDFRYSEFNPISFVFFDETYTLDRYNYTQLLTTFLNILYDLETDRFIELAGTGYKPMASDRIYISTNSSDVRHPCVLGGQIYVETNLSSKYIVKFMYQLIKEVGLNYNDMIINLKHK